MGVLPEEKPMTHVYIRADSKAELNRRLADPAQQKAIHCYKVGLCSIEPVPLLTIADRTAVKIFSEQDGRGQPIAKAYGNWDAKRRRVK